MATKRYDEIISKMQNKYGGKKEEEKSSSTTQQVSNQNQGNSTKTKSQKIVDNANARISKMQAKYNPSSQVNESYIRSFMDDVKRFTESSQKSYDSMGYLTASSDYDSRKKIADNLTERSRFISKYLDEHKDSLDEDTYSSFKSYLKDFDMASTQSMYAMYQKKDYFSQWETFDDYNKYVAYQKDYDEKSQYDLDAGQKEIEALEAELQKLKKTDSAPGTYVNGRPYAASQQANPTPSPYLTGNTTVNSRPYAAGQQAQNEVSPTAERERELEKLISQKKKYLNQAKHIQEGITLSGVVDNTDFKASSGYVSTYDDSRWAKLTGKEYDETYEYINNQNGIRDEIEQKHRNYGADNPFDDGESRFKEKGYDLLNENEIAIYNYYYAKEGKEKAQEYLDNIQETLNGRKAAGIYEPLEGKTAQELIFGIVAGLDQFESGMKNLFNTEDDYIAQTAYQIASGMVREDLADDGFNFWYNFKDKEWQGSVFGNSVGQVAYDAITTSANMAPSILVGSVLGSGFGSAMMGMSAAGGAYQQALNEGYDKNQARGYSILVGASEVVMEKVLGGISAYGGNALGKTLTKNVANADTALKMIAKRLGGSMISEFSEEYLQEVLDPVFQNIALGTDHDVKLISAEAIYSGILGALTAGIMEGPTTIYGEVKNYSTGKQLKAADISAARLAEIGKTFSADSVAYQLAGKVDENTGAYALGRLFNEIGATLTEQNKADITKALVEKNMGEITAKKNAEVLAYVVEGGQLTDRDAAIIEANTALAEVARTVLIDANSTVNQRTKGYNEALMALAKEKASPKTAQTKAAEAGKENAPASDKVDTQKENGSEGSSEVDTSPSQVSSITSIKNRMATIKLEDGSEVSVKDADLSPEDGVRIETIAKIDGISAADANAVLGVLRVSTGASAQMDSLGASEAYRYGRYGLSKEYMAEHGVFVNSLTEAQRDTIYEIGQRARQQQVASKQTEIEKSVQEAKAALENEPAEVSESRSYRATLEDGISVLSLNESQKASYKLADQIAEAAKVNIRVYVSKTGEHGYYNPDTDEIYLNLNATNKSRKSMMAFTLGHELVHRAKKGSPAKYEAFANFLVEQYGKQGSSVEAMIAEELAAAKEFGIEMSYDKAFEEVVCNACQRMLLDTDAGQKLAAFGAQNKQNKNFLDDVKRWITEFMDKLRSIFAGVDPDSMAAKEFAKFDESVKQILADMYVDMTIDAGENLSVIQNAFGKDTQVHANENGEFTMANSEDGSKKVFNLVTWNNGGRETLEATLLREGYTEDEVNAALTIMDEKQRLVESIANEVDGNGKMAFPEQGRINEATLTTDLKDGHSVLSALVSNGDYPVNIDLLMVCKKRKAYQRVINRLCETGLIQQATVDALAIAEINKILGKYGFETACLGCFVESRRLRIQEWAQTIVKEWNSEVKKRNPNAKAFGFGKGEATLTPDEVMKIIGELESGGPKNDKGNLNLGQGSAVKRMGVLLDKVPSLQRTLSIEDLITPDGLTSLRSFDSNLFSMVKSRYGSNSPKFVQEFNPYNHELAKYGKVPTQYESLREYLYAIGGARMQSFSDFIIENWFDYCQIVADLAARKLPMHTYTKEIALAKLFGLTGIKINMSLIPDVDRSLGKEFAGLTRNSKGELELIWADKDRFKATGGKSYMQSINFADAIALQNDPRYSANVGTIAVGISDKHIEVMLDDARIRMIIPYHSSGMNPIFADLMGTSYYKDYTNFQNTTIKQLYNSKGQPVTLKLEKAQADNLTSGFQFNEVLQDLGDARAAAEAYKEWCADASKHTITIKGETYTAELTPKFNDFSGHQNYYKLLEDFNTYDCITEEAARQGDVQQNYPEDFDKILKAELKAQEGHRQKQETNQAFDKAMGEIESYLKDHSKADTIYYAQQHGIKLSKKDSKLDTAEKAKLKKLQEEGASFSLPRSEPAPTFYSHMARVVDGVKQEKLGAASVVSMLRGRGVKAEEIKWSGIETFLEGKKSVTKAELQKFIAGSMLQIEEDTLNDKEIPYSQEHMDQIAKYEAERDTIAENLKSEWKRIVGTDIPIRNFGAGLESAVVNNLLLANSEIKGNTEAGFKYKAAKAALQRCIENSDDYYGFDNERQAFREAVRNPKDFMKSYELTAFEKGVFRDFVKAKEEYNKVEGISTQDQRALIAIAASADRFNNRIVQVKTEHRTEAAKYLSKYRSYTIKGGTNYRELLFRMPGSTYSNGAMNVHWERSGVLAHARMQDLNTFLGKMLFIEEIQSDWHNEGYKSGYKTKEDEVKAEKKIQALEGKKAKLFDEIETLDNAYDSFLNEYWASDMTEAEYDRYVRSHTARINELRSEERAIDREINKLIDNITQAVPDAPFRDTYHEYVLKRLIRIAAEQDYDSIGWTPAQIQVERWSEEFAEGYRIEYDQDIPKFLNKYGKKWGTKVGKTVLDSGTEIWSMAITDEMKESVLTEGQPLYSLPRARNFSYQELTAKPDLQGKVIDSSQQVKMTATGLVDEEWLVELIKDKCDSVRTKSPEPKYYVNVPDIERNVEITKKGIHHALIRNKLNPNGKVPDAVLVNARAMINLPEILANSIEVNRSQRGANIDVPFTRVMMGVTGIENASGIDEYYAVRIMVEERANQDPILVEANVLGKLYAVNAKKISNPHAQVTTKGVALTTDRLFSYSVADVLNDVKTVFDNTFSTDVYQKLNTSRKADDFSSHLLHKLPVGEDTSPRALLANAFDTVITNPIEKNKMQEYKKNVAMLNEEEAKLRDLREQIKELSFAKGPKDTKKIRSLQFEANQAANRINTLDKMLLRFEASAPLQNVLNREKELAYKRAEKKGKEDLAAYRERAAKTQRELMDRWEESRKRGIDSRQRTAMRHKIKDVVNELNQYLLKGTKDRHVPIGLQKAVAEALNAVNMDTVGAEERIAKLQAELMKAKTPEAIQEISKKIEHIREMGDRMDEKLKRLKEAYDEFINSDDPLIANSHDDAVAAHMMKLIVRVGDTPLREMTLDQLQDVYDVYRVVLATIRNANKSFKDNKNRDISTRASQVMAEIDSLGVKRGKKPAFMSWIEKFGWDGLKPVYAMEHIGSKGLIDAYNNVRAGEDTWAKDIVEAREFYLEKFKKYKYDSWNFEKKYKFTSTTGKDFELTLDQIMSLYAYSKRDQAEDHLKYGGIVFDPKTEVVEKTKSGIKVKYNVANATAYNISADTLTEIISILKDEQTDFVDEMQAYLSDVMGAKGNEVSLAMYDVKLFREKHYFPLKSAHQYMAKAKEQAQGDVKIKNSGFSKETKPHAKNPIVLSSFMDVWSSHVNEMSMYHAFVLPMEDFYRIYNYTTPSKDESMPPEGVVPYIENAYGSGATEYIEQMLKDLNGGARSDSRTGFINKMMGLFKKGAVFASLSVVVQQPSAIARSAALVDTKYFIGPKVDHKRHKALWDEVKQYAPVAIIKEMGYFDTNMGKSTQDFIMGQEYSGFSEKMKALVTDSDYRDEVLSKAPALADEIAWCGIWEAVKRETKDANPGMDVTSDAFLKKAGERFTEVIVKTQVYDSVLSRSAMMRSKDTGMKMATAFMAEPTTSINMVADALLKGKRGDRKYARTAIGAVVASQILNSILVSFVYAARDDDEDETYWEKYIGTLSGEILDSLNPAGYIPFIKDIQSIVKGYDVERSDMAVVSDLFKAWQNLKKDDVSVYRKVEGFAGSIAQIFGLPVKNIMRDARGIYQTVMSFMNSQEKTTKAGIGYAIKGAITGKTATNKEQLYEARMAGDEAHTARVEARYGDTDSADAAVRAAIKDSFMADEIDEATALKQMVLYAGMDASEAHWLMDAWKYRKTVGSEDGYSKYGRFYDAVRTGKNLKAVVKEYTDNGIKPSTLSGQITEEFKPEYVKMSASQRASMKGYLVNAFTLCGMDRENAMEKLESWDFEAKHGFAYSERKEAYMTGMVSETEMVKILMDRGYSQEDAVAQVEVYEWENQGYDEVTAAAVREYNEHCAADNVPKDVYLYIRDFSNNTENDVDENGKTVYYSAMKKVMAEIGAQTGLTTAQKYAIARSLGWSEKNIQKYKTW